MLERRTASRWSPPAATGTRSYAAVDAEHPDVVVTDIRMPPELHATRACRWPTGCATRIPASASSCSASTPSRATACKLLDRGSDGRAYLLKDRIRYRGQLVSAIETVARGGSMIDAKVIDALITARTAAESSPLTELTPRELEILSFVARGHSNQAIADELVLTKRAVEKHINAIFLKLGLHDALDVSRRVKAALIYLAESPAD